MKRAAALLLRHSHLPHLPRPPASPRVFANPSLPTTVTLRSPGIMLAGPSRLRSQTHSSQASVSEYVEDSEPEREERRTRKKKASCKKKRAPTPVQLPEVIELTDSDASYHVADLLPSPTKAKSKPVLVIDIFDDSDRSPPRINGRVSRDSVQHHNDSRDLPSALDGCTTDDSLPSIGRILGLPPRQDQYPPTVNGVSTPEEAHIREQPLAVTITSPSPEKVIGRSEDGEQGSLKLDHFAYAPPNPLRRTASKTPSPTDSGSVPPEGRVVRKPKSITSHRFGDEFSDLQLARILKCVSCDLAWTTRKTVPQKMKHMQTCAKKNGLSDETVRVLLRKELDSLPPVASSSKSKSATPVPPSTPVPETLLEEVLKDASKKKPGRRPQVLQTVKSVTETRETILDKARSLLGDSAGSSAPHTTADTPVVHSREAPPATQAFSKSHVAATRVPPEPLPADVTQVFGPSRLGVGSSRTQGGVVRAGAEIAAQSDVCPLTQVPVENDAAQAEFDEVEDMPPSTQIFAPSKFTNALGVVRRVVTCADPPDAAISIHDTSDEELTKSSPARPTPPRSPPSLNANPPQPCSPARPRNDAPPTPPPLPVFQPSPPPSLMQSWSPAADGWPDAYPPAPLDHDPAPPHEYDDNREGWAHPPNAWRSDDDDDACLHYVPELELGTAGAGPSRAVPPDEPEHVHEQPPSPPRRRLVTILEDGPGPLGAGEDPSLPPAKKKTRRKKATAEESDAESKAGDIPQDELNVRMKAALLKDEALHLRVLRYEPIHFDVFLQMAIDLGMPAKRSGLKAKVRAFLDQKAIHFYGADPSKSRTRRTRHP
ncbi:hypothetical protein C8Q78DRAFT_1002906 [Trametes maxima]|nr:hypothetical protein C8Q78DRAFT_1002906 [Trametes maxima]